jgi:hypothetical protein
MLLSDPTTKKAASAKAETWRQEILDICPTLSDEGAAEDQYGGLVGQPARSARWTQTRIFMFNLDLS